MRSGGDSGDPARDFDGDQDPGRLMRWLRLAADVLEHRGGRRGSTGKKGGDRVEDDETEGKTTT
jgi:hypothetical protein